MKEQLPNSILRKLASNDPVGSHADADQLIGFAEGTLTKRERELVMAHLASCTECRETTAIATDAAPAPMRIFEPTKARPFHLSFRLWLPWAATTAGAVIISSAVLLHQSSARHEPRQADPASTYVVPQEIKEAKIPQELSPDRGKDSATVEVNSSKATHRKRQNAPLIAEKQKMEDTVNSAAPPPPPDAAAKTQESWIRADMPMRANESQRVATKPLSSSTNGAFGENLSAPPAARKTERTYTMPDDLAESKSFDDNQPLRKMTASTVSSRLHWRIDDQGHLQRSPGTGEWQTVLANESLRIHAVSALGARVWAGGENLRLYVSDDNGANWKSVTLPNKNGIAQIITQIHFDNEQVGRIETDKGTVWITNDRGVTWK